jgi:pyridoxine 4-dehydrogenase
LLGDTNVIDLKTVGTYLLGKRSVKRMGYGAMQLAGPGVFGPPKDRDAALAVLREAVGTGVDHIDTSDYYPTSSSERHCTPIRRASSL